MFSRIEINMLQGGFAFGQMLFEDGTAIPVQFPLDAYYDLCAKGFFTMPANIPPNGKVKPTEGEPLNFSDVWYTEETIQIDRLEEASGQRVF